MTDETKLSDQRTLASPWPILIAFGLAIAEVGVLLGIRPVAIGGLVLFLVTVTGILRESGYILQPSRTAGVLGAFFVGIGTVLIAVHQGGPPIRGHSFIIAGGLALAGILLWRRFIHQRLQHEAEVEPAE